jgi:outer membrane protein assembly factor BamB
MPDDVRIGAEPSPAPPPRGARLVVVVAGLILLAAAGAWLAGVFGGDATTTTLVPDATLTFTTTTTPASTTTRPLEERLAAAATFWDLLGRGGAAAAAAAAFPEAPPAAIDLMGFVAAFQAGFVVEHCTDFAANAVQCNVTVANGHLLAIGSGTPGERLRVAEDGWFDVPAVLASAASRLSLYALDAHTGEVRTACPVTDNPQVPRLAIVGSATAECGAYLAGLIPEYLAAALPGDAPG